VPAAGGLVVHATGELGTDVRSDVADVDAVGGRHAADLGFQRVLAQCHAGGRRVAAVEPVGPCRIPGGVVDVGLARQRGRLSAFLQLAADVVAAHGVAAHRRAQALDHDAVAGGARQHAGEPGDTVVAHHHAGGGVHLVVVRQAQVATDHRNAGA